MHEELAEGYKEILAWRVSYTGCFSNKLFDLMSKADSHNRERLKIAFPKEFTVFEDWEQAKDEPSFLEEIRVLCKRTRA